MLFASIGGDRTEQVYMTALWNSFETIIQQAEHVIIFNYLGNEWDLKQLTTSDVGMNSVKMYAKLIICHGFDNKIGIINVYHLAVTFYK